MTSAEQTVQVRGEDGSLHAVTRTMWRTHHGPMLNMPLLGWGNEVAFSYRDANADNTAVLEQFLGMAMADDLADFRRVFHEVKALPWVNTLAVDGSGDAWYTDASATPALSDAADRALPAPPGRGPGGGARVPEPHRDARRERARRRVGRARRRPLPRPGATRAPARAARARRRGERERLALVVAPAAHAGGVPGALRAGAHAPQPAHPPEPAAAPTSSRSAVGSPPDDVLGAVFDNASLSASVLLRDAVVERCRAAGSVDVGRRAGGPARRGGRAGGMGRVGEPGLGGCRCSGGSCMCRFDDAPGRAPVPLFAVDFDPDDAIGDTAHARSGAGRRRRPGAGRGGDGPAGAGRAPGVALDVPLGEVQWAQRGEQRVPVHGGGEAEGMLNVLAPVGALRIQHARSPPQESNPLLPGHERTRAGRRRVPGHLRHQLPDGRRDDTRRARGASACSRTGRAATPARSTTSTAPGPTPMHGCGRCASATTRSRPTRRCADSSSGPPRRERAGRGPPPDRRAASMGSAWPRSVTGS